MLLGAAALVASVVTGGCGSNAANENAADGKVELNFTNWISSEQATIPAYNAMVAEFEKKNPNIKIKTTTLPFNQIKDQLLVAAAGGRAPDVAQVKQEWVPSLQATKVLAPADKALGEATMKDFYPSLLRKDQGTGETVSVPWAPSVVQLYYNKKLLQKAGAGTQPPATWTQMLQMSRKVAALGKNEQGNQVYGVGISDKKLEGAGYFLLPWLWNQGGELLTDGGAVAFNSPQNVAALTEIGRLFREKIAPAGVEIKDLRNLFAQGQLGFYLDIEAAVGIHDKASPQGAKFRADYGVAALPGQTAGRGRTFYTQHDLVLFKNSKHPKEAAAFVDFLSGPEGLRVYNANKGFKLPGRESAAKIEFYSTPESEVLKPFIAALPSAEPLPATNAKFTTAMESLASAVTRVQIGENPQSVVQGTADVLSKAYQR